MLIAGLDEVGRGPLAGPVVAAAVVLPAHYENPAIKDSKALSARNREELVPIIKQAAIAWSIVAVGHTRISRLNIREASRLAMTLALSRIASRRITVSEVLVDGNVPIELPHYYSSVPQRTIVSGDSLVVQISAASILAKVWRDDLMKVLAKKYPSYGFERHAGYPTKTHRKAIAQFGPCRIHRSTFSGVREYCSSLYA